jgi:hypothetical protein
LKNCDSIKIQALHVAEVSKQMRICGAKHRNVEDEPFKWFCHAHTNIPVESPMVTAKINEMALKMGIKFCLNGWLQ